MNWLFILYNILLTVVVIDALAGAYVAVYIFRLRQRFGTYLAMAFAAAAAEGWASILLAGFSSRPARIIGWVVAIRIVFRLAKVAALVMLAAYLLGYLNGDRPKDKNATTENK